MILGKYSFGIGDRFSHQGKPQLAALIKARQQGLEITPVWNKSHREHKIIGTSHADISLLTSGRLSMLFFAYVILGLIVPLGIAYYITKLESARASASRKFLPNTLKQISASVILFSLSGFVLVLIGGFLLRYVILIAGQIII